MKHKLFFSLASTLLIASLLITSLVAISFVQSEKANVFPTQLHDLIEQFPSLPRYVEGGYSPLGRSPVVDAVLGDPFYLPTYGNQVSQELKKSSSTHSVKALSTTVFTAAALPFSEQNNFQLTEVLPEIFKENFGEKLGLELFTHFKHFLQIKEQSESALSSISQEEKAWLLANYNSFFFGQAERVDEYDFFTTNNPMPLKFFEIASRIDLASLASLSRELASITDQIYLIRKDLESLNLNNDFLWEEKNIKLFISTKSKTTHTDSYDFFIDAGGYNTLYSSAGGTLGTMSAALHIDLKGHNFYRGENFTQGAGFLGVGLLANFSGNNQYKAVSFSQGCGFFGSGMLINYGGNNQFEVDFGGQSMALFGSSILWNQEGSNSYVAHEGMAQAASSTLGVAFLIESGGKNNYISGVKGKGGSLFGGMGQGGSIGVRSYPWVGHPSFYGGVSFLYLMEGYNHFMTPWIGQGSAYFLGVGILVAEGSYDQFEGDYDLQGQGLHLASGLLIHKGGKSYFNGGWGSLGVGGDRATGFFIATKGGNHYEGTDQSIGTSRKPKAIGVFIDLEGDNTYLFKKLSNANIQLPQSPDEWSTALFLELGPNNTYPQDVDSMTRGNNLSWGIPKHSWGIDHNSTFENFETELFAQFPKEPRLPFKFNPLHLNHEALAYKPLTKIQDTQTLQEAIQSLKNASYELRRHLYESIDLALFSNKNLKPDFTSLLKDAASLPEDLLNFISLWNLVNPHKELKPVIDGLMQKTILSDYARKMAIYAVGSNRDANLEPLFFDLLNNDPYEENRALAATQMMKVITDNSYEHVNQAAQNPLEMIRYNVAQKLQDSKVSFASDILSLLLEDESFYVKRAAALSSLSLGNKEGIDVLLGTLDKETLDTTDNYGDNIFNSLAYYVGVDFGLDKDAWLAWWKKERDTFEFPSKEKKAA